MRFGLELLLAMGAGAVLAAAVVRADLPVARAIELGAARKASASAPPPVVVIPTGRKWASPLLDAPFLERFTVTLRNLHTDELFAVPVEGVTSGPALDRFLRCRVTGDRTRMRPEPIAVAVAMALRHDVDEIQVISGYRTSRFNEMLRKKGHQVARASQHPLGQALDFRIPSVSSVRLARQIAEFHDGGVGVYRRSGFVHVDMGPKREWRGR
jgi:uncharacterized protein YcbK (DUF882 family)